MRCLRGPSAHPRSHRASVEFQHRLSHCLLSRRLLGPGTRMRWQWQRRVQRDEAKRSLPGGYQPGVASHQNLPRCTSFTHRYGFPQIRRFRIVAMVNRMGGIRTASLALPKGSLKHYSPNAIGTCFPARCYHCAELAALLSFLAARSTTESSRLRRSRTYPGPAAVAG